jgi:hypothetical protein
MLLLPFAGNFAGGDCDNSAVSTTEMRNAQMHLYRAWRDAADVVRMRAPLT